jgi:hypothetical protein
MADARDCEQMALCSTVDRSVCAGTERLLQLWQHVRDLRDVLGWRDAVVALGGAYALDANTQWQTAACT